MAHYTPMAPRVPSRSTPRPLWPPHPLFWLLVLAAGLFWSFVFVALRHGLPSRYTPLEQAFLASQVHAAGQLQYPSTSEMARIDESQVFWLGHRSYEVHSWIGGANRVGIPVRQAYVARVYCPPGARRFAEWQLLNFRFE